MQQGLESSNKKIRQSFSYLLSGNADLAAKCGPEIHCRALATTLEMMSDGPSHPDDRPSQGELAATMDTEKVLNDPALWRGLVLIWDRVKKGFSTADIKTIESRIKSEIRAGTLVRAPGAFERLKNWQALSKYREYLISLATPEMQIIRPLVAAEFKLQKMPWPQALAPQRVQNLFANSGSFSEIFCRNVFEKLKH